MIINYLNALFPILFIIFFLLNPFNSVQASDVRILPQPEVGEGICH